MPKAREERWLPRECMMCGVIFEAVRDDAKTCSMKCRQWASRVMRKVRAEEAREKARKTCGGCGRAREPGVIYCRQCGHIEGLNLGIGK